MLRVLLALCLMASMALASLRLDWRPRPASACSIAPPYFEADVKAAAIIIVAEAVEVGGAANEQPLLPTATPTATYPPLPSSTPEFTATRTPRNYRSPTPEDTELAAPSATPYPPKDLTGLRAALKPRAVYAGDVGETIEVDAQQRAEYERELRRREAGYIPPPCSAFAPYRYVAGREYFVMGRTHASGAWTSFVVPVEDNTLVFPPNSGLSVLRSTYDRYFSDFPAEFGDPAERGFVRIDRITLARFSAAVQAIRSGIAPPETGSDGLADPRARRY